MFKVLICSLYVVLPRRRRGQNLTRREAARKICVVQRPRTTRTTPTPEFIAQMDTFLYIVTYYIGTR